MACSTVSSLRPTYLLTVGAGEPSFLLEYRAGLRAASLDRSRRIVSSTPRHRSISVASHSCIPRLRQLCVSANEEEPRPRIRCSRRPRASCRMGPASAERSPTSLPPLAGRLRRPPAIVASPSTSLASPSSGRWHGRLPHAASAATYEDDNATSCTCHCLPPRWWHRLRGTACSAELGILPASTHSL
jgi:hypothetical protein